MSMVKNSNHSIVAEYIPEYCVSEIYDAEKALERELMGVLQNHGYEHLHIVRQEDLFQNLRVQLSMLNDIAFSETEWQQMLNEYLVNKNQGMEEKTSKIQEDHMFNLKRDDGSIKKVRILDKHHIHNNSIQVINQYDIEGARKNRYDVTLLVNGLPMVHVELKPRGVGIDQAFNSINCYQRDSFWAESGLFDYVQLFVISNGMHTTYYANTIRRDCVKKQQGRESGKKTINSFALTCWWTDAKNKRVADLVNFSETFLSKHLLLPILIKYCVFTSDKRLLVMRPYQIAAAERIIQRIAIATNHKRLGTVHAGGYICHTTGSGKTLLSFKTAQLASQLDGVDKVLFVVDQTMREYDSFQKGSANTSTRMLTEQLADSSTNIIITTIQTLAKFIAAHKKHPVFAQHVVLIFDECYGSPFAHMHTAMTKAFKHYHLFGVTASSGSNPEINTTELAFGDKLHAYTMVDEIEFDIERVKQEGVHIDYVLQLLAQYHQSKMKDQAILITIDKAIDASITLRSNKPLIKRFIKTLNVHSEVVRDWRGFTEKTKAEALEKIIAEEHLKPEKTKALMADAFRKRELQYTGTLFADILPPISMFDKDNARGKKKRCVFEKLTGVFETYLAL